MEELIEKYHTGQTRNKGHVPYVVHLYGVREILKNLILAEEEIPKRIARDLGNAALGHDLLEDTEVLEEEIVSCTNEKVLRYIKEVTNPEDDSHTMKYMEQIKRASEEGRLIKYADLIDNTLSVAYGLHELGQEWVESFYLPILKRTKNVLEETSFEKYPRTAKQARIILDMAVSLLSCRLSK